MRPTFRYCTGWACAALVATTLSWVAIRDVVATAAVGDPVPAHSVVAARGVGATTAPSTGRVRLATPSDTVVPSVSLSPRARKPVTPWTATSQPTATGRPTPTGSPSPSGWGGWGGWGGGGSGDGYWGGCWGCGGGYGGYGSQEWGGQPHGEYRGYSMRGGQVVVELRWRDARLVSAVPASGYATRTSTTATSIRVDFVDGQRRSTLVVSWSEQRSPSGTVTET